MGLAEQIKGSQTEFKAATYFAGEGYAVFFPVATGGIIDFVAYRPDRGPLLIQAKTAYLNKQGREYLQVRLGRTRYGPRENGKMHKTRDWDPTAPEDRFDYLFIAFEQHGWLIPFDEMPEGKKTLYFDTPERPRLKASRTGYDPNRWKVA